MNITPLNKTTPYKLAFIGGSNKSAIGLTHYLASRMDNYFVLEAGCFSRDHIINKDTAKEWNLNPARLYDNWQELLEKEKRKIDAVVILTPTPHHFEIIIKALQLGYPVISEKCVTANSEDAETIKEVLHRKKGFLSVTYNYSGYPMLRELKYRIKKGDLGKLLHTQIEMPQESFIRKNLDGTFPLPQDWRQKDLTLPGITLDLGTHCHHLVAFLTELKPIETICDQTHCGSMKNVIDNVTALVRYENNFRANFWYSKSAIGNRNGLKIRIFGSEGSAEWIQEDSEKLFINYVNGQKNMIDRSSISDVASNQRYNRFKVGHPSGFIEAFSNLYRDIAFHLDFYFKHIKDDTGYVFGIEHALEGLYLFEAMQESFQTNKWTNLNNIKSSSEQCTTILNHL